MKWIGDNSIAFLYWRIFHGVGIYCDICFYYKTVYINSESTCRFSWDLNWWLPMPELLAKLICQQNSPPNNSLSFFTRIYLFGTRDPGMYYFLHEQSLSCIVVCPFAYRLSTLWGNWTHRWTMLWLAGPRLIMSWKDVSYKPDSIINISLKG